MGAQYEISAGLSEHRVALALNAYESPLSDVLLLLKPDRVELVCRPVAGHDRFVKRGRGRVRRVGGRVEHEVGQWDVVRRPHARLRRWAILRARVGQVDVLVDIGVTPAHARLEVDTDRI